MNSSECTPSMNSGQHKKILAFLGSLLIVIINYFNFIYTSHSVMIIKIIIVIINYYHFIYTSHSVLCYEQDHRLH